MNRKERRKMEGVDKRGPKPVTSGEAPTQRASVELHLSKAPALRGDVVKTGFTVVGKTDFQLWANIVGEALARMGYTRAELAIGMTLDMVNQWPMEFRQLMMVGIAKGLGLQIFITKAMVCDKCKAVSTDPREFRHDGECDGKPEERELLQGHLDPTYEPLKPPEKQEDGDMRRTGSGLLVPR